MPNKKKKINKKENKKETEKGKIHYNYGGVCECGKQIATASKRCRRCQGKHRSRLNAQKRLKALGV